VNSSLAEPIAIVGLACRFPGAQDAIQFWANLRGGKEGLRHLSDQELLAAGVPAESLANPKYVKVNGDAPGMEMFDAEFFGMTPREATLCDPQLRLFLESAHACVEDAGYDPLSVSDVGVYAAIGHSLYLDHNLQASRPDSRGGRDFMAGVLNYPDYVSTLVSYKLDFTGPSMTVLTACSSSLLTVHLAVQALRNGECAMALAGGTEAEMKGHGYWWAPGGPLSRDGRCRPFDADATGTIFSSGVGAVMLKRLSDAVRDGDHVRAVIRDTAANNDGASKMGFSAPSVTGQTAVITEALRICKAAPEDIGYVEAHGTGTPIGDPIEFAALQDAFRQVAEGRDLPNGYCGLGSVKSSIGHTGHAAGIASLIKVALCLEHELLAPTLHVSQPNPKFDLDGSPFFLATAARPWPATPGRVRLASVNSLGFGGTNVHAILAEAPVPAPVTRSERPRLVVWSGQAEAAAQEYRARLAAHFAGQREEAFGDIVTTLQEGRTAHRFRAAAVCASGPEATASLGSGEVIQGERRPVPRPVVFLFPGQGSQHARMAAGLHGLDPLFTETLDDCLGWLEAAGGGIGQAWPDGAEDKLEPTEVAQQALFAVEYALARMWQSWGVEPAALLGHSIGELVAATVAGVFALPDAARLVVARAQAMAEMPQGAMLAVSAPADEISDLLPDGVTISLLNSPRQTVVGGSCEAIDEAARRFADQTISTRRLRTAYAFHSPAMAPAAAAFAEAFIGVPVSAPAVPVYSAATGAMPTAEEMSRPRFWADQLVAPVRFGQAVAGLAAGQEWAWLEVGPEQALTALLRGHPDVPAAQHLVLPTLPRRGGDPGADMRTALTALGSLWADGHAVNWAALRPGEPLRRLPVPGYPYQRSRYWAEPSAQAGGQVAGPETAGVRIPAHGEAGPAAGSSAPEAESAAVTPFATLGWVEEALPATTGRQGTPAMALVPADQETALPIVLALQQARLRIVPVRPGNAYSDTGFDLVVRPGHPGDLDRARQALADRGAAPELLIHAWTAGEWPAATPANAGEQLALSFGSLLDLVQRGMRRAAGGKLPGLLVLTSRSADVSGGEPVDPVKATLHGAVRTLALEDPHRYCRLVDVGPGVGEVELAAEVGADVQAGVVALRRGRRWSRIERPHLLAPPGRPPLRRNGVYLITGGFGGLGTEVARTLARTGLRPSLALVGRRDPGESAVRSLRAECEALGAQVHTFAADVGDERAMRRTVDTITARLGAVNGVFHLAGLPGDGMLLVRDRADAARVLHPKVLGTLVLREIFADRAPLDLFVAFSSRAAIDGLIGSGDYAAANAFLDACAAGQPGWLSVNWPAWNTVGMAARTLLSRAPEDSGIPPEAAGTSQEDAGTRRWETVLDADSYPFLDEHRIGADGVALLPGTGHLDLVLRAFRDQADGPVRMREVVFRRPLVGSRRVIVSFRPDGGRWQFTVESEPVNGGETLLHVTGEISATDDLAPAADLSVLRARIRDQEPLEPISGPGRLLNLGPHWANVREILVRRDGAGTEKLVSLELPAAFTGELSDHPLHPTLLDSATGSTPDRGDGFHLPFMYRSLTMYAPLPPLLVSHIRRRAAADGMVVADVDLISPEERVAVAVEGFMMRRIQSDYMERLERPGLAERSPPPDAGITPETGCQLLLRLLAAQTPQQVAVRPFRQGRPLPLAAGPLPTWPGGRRPDPEGRPPQRSAAGRPSAPALPRPPALPQPPGVPQSAGETARNTAADIEERLSLVWTAALGVSDISASSDFFGLGGNSLAGIDLMNRIREEFGVELSIAMLFDHPTLGSLAAAIADQIGEQKDDRIHGK
jgi:phthiocerol/phenolphthiocerol synthesis type-I polyketide synthase E